MQLNYFKRLRAGMRRGERGMAARMPVLREHHVFEARGEPVDDRHHLVAPRHGERAAGHEVVLRVDDHQAGVAHCYFIFSSASSTASRSAPAYERQPKPSTVPFAADEMIEWPRHSSRVWRFDMCTSITGNGIALMQSCSETPCCVRPPGVMSAPAAASLGLWDRAASAASWFDWDTTSPTLSPRAGNCSVSLISASVIVP